MNLNAIKPTLILQKFLPM